MAGNAIGPLTAKIIANSEGLDPGLKAAEDKVKASADKMGEETAKSGEESGKRWAERWAEGASSFAKGAMSFGMGFAKYAEKAMTNPGRVFADAVGVMGNIAGRMPVLGPLLALPFEGVNAAATMALDAYDKGTERIKLLGQEAMRANMPLGDFQVLVEAMGGDVSAAAAQIFKFQAVLDDAADAGLNANTVFSRLDLDPLKLQAMGTRAALGAYADKVRGLGNAFAQAASAKEIWGRGAADLMPTLLRGSEFIEKRGKLLSGFGANVSDADFENIRKAQAAKKEWAYLWQGLETQVTVGLAPVFSAIADVMPKLSELGVSAKGLSSIVFDIASNLAVVGGSIIDLFREPAAALERLGSMWGKLQAQMLSGIEALGRKLGESFRAGLFDSKTVQGWFFDEKKYRGEWNELLKKAGAPQLGSAPQGGGLWDSLKGFFGGPDRSFVGPPKPTVADELINSLAAVERRMKETKQLGATLNPFESWLDSLKRMGKEFESPLHKIKESHEKLQKQLKPPVNLLQGDPNVEGGFNALEIEKRLAAAKKAKDKLAGEVGFQLLGQLRAAAGGGAALGSQFVGAAEAGSREAYSAITQYKSARETLEEEIVRLFRETQDIEKRHLDEGRKANELLGDLLANLKVGGDF